jgi:hypothetical protein
MPTKRDERKMDVIASCDSYSFPRSHLSFPLPPAGNNGAERKRSSRQLGLVVRERGRGISGGSQPAGAAG